MAISVDTSGGWMPDKRMLDSQQIGVLDNLIPWAQESKAPSDADDLQVHWIKGFAGSGKTILLIYAMLQTIKLSLDSFLLALGLKTLFFLNIFLDSSIISLNVEPIKILDTNVPFFFKTSLENLIASRHNSLVWIESRFLFPVVFTAISEMIISILP